MYFVALLIEKRGVVGDELGLTELSPGKSRNRTNKVLLHLSGNGVNQELWQSLDATCRGTAG